MASSAESGDTAAFEELQLQYIQTSNALKQVALAGRGREQERQRCLLTMSELDPLPESATLFRGLGRAYVQAESKTAVLTELRTAVEGLEEELESLVAKKKALEKTAKEAEASIQELLRSNEALARTILGRQ